MIFLWRKPQAPAKKTLSQYILGVSSCADGSAAAMLRDGEVIFSACEPRGAQDGGAAPAFPETAVKAALEKASETEGEILGLKDMAAAAFCGKPLREYGRYRREWLESAPAGFSRFLETAPAAFAKKRLGEGLLERQLSAASWGETPAATLYPEHQLCCAAAAFYPSRLEDAAILVLDGPGEEASASILLGSGEKIKVLRELDYPDSPQLFCRALAAYAGFGASPAGLYSAGAPADRARSDRFFSSVMSELAVVREDGSLRLNRRYFRASDGLKPDLPRWRELFGLPPGGPSGEAADGDFAAAARAAAEEVVFRLGAQAKRLAGSNNLCVYAGPDLRLAAEGKLKAAGLFSRFGQLSFAVPEGRAAGAALAARYMHFGARRPAPGAEALAAAPEERPGPAADARPARLSAADALGYSAYFWLALAPRGAFRGGGGSEPQASGSFYKVKGRLYSGEDLRGPG